MSTNQNELQDKLAVEGVNANGYGVMPKLVMQDKRLTIEAKSIYAYIVSFAGAGSTAFPSLRKILEDLQISEKRFYKHRKLLIDCNYISVTQIRNEKKEIIKNLYTLISNPKIEEEVQDECIRQNDCDPIPQFDGYPISQNDRHKINSFKINNIKDDDDINNACESKLTHENFSSYSNQNGVDCPLTVRERLTTVLKGKDYLAPLTVSLLAAGVSDADCLEIIQFIVTLPVINEEVSDLVNAQIRANEIEAKTNGLTSYKAYFITGLKQKLENADIFVQETNIVNPDTIKPLPTVTMHNWV
ncbi:helix-turn-helix domain-containing protein [Enterococcus faecalis]|uniref:helix-turn-helix domain-containing protein n=1 Tax=Enterococcus faecalis TaxID=1351 RepID=UPI0011575BF5|nr:helix-turn-helix domain-containing protein [Enterococcus faecalis]